MKYEDELARIIVNCSYKIHTTLGPGLLESVYEAALCYELIEEGLEIKQQCPMPVSYNNVRLDIGFRADIIVEDVVIIEVKAVEETAPVHFKQLLTYLKVTHLKLGLLINFNKSRIKDGLHRVANNL